MLCWLVASVFFTFPSNSAFQSPWPQGWAFKLRHISGSYGVCLSSYAATLCVFVAFCNLPLFIQRLAFCKQRLSEPQNNMHTYARNERAEFSCACCLAKRPMRSRIARAELSLLFARLSIRMKREHTRTPERFRQFRKQTYGVLTFRSFSQQTPGILRRD